MDLSSIIALKVTFAVVALLCFREALVQETKGKRILGWVLGALFLFGGVFAFTDVNAHETEVRMCVYYSMTRETHCMPATTAGGCIATVNWFKKETMWHNKNRYCCVSLNEDPNMCLPDQSSK